MLKNLLRRKFDKIKKEVLKKIEVKTGYKIQNIIDNYFAATFILVIIKLILSTICMKINFTFNLFLLIIFVTISIKSNFYKKLKTIYIKMLNSVISEKVKDEFDGLEEE